MDYSVTWRIELEAKSREDAARQALEIHRDPGSLATSFEVEDENGMELITVAEPSHHPGFKIGGFIND